ncbi:uncharacterized protein Z518_04652 [Rhinocladiella mackenziei CBS 650.93]|uniref:RNA recognition motif-containing protein n=1 Tax=Rhinocladiella mackenziei CBS 650.93 TaxID=1442369 RepID=A0A0D2IU32_9EURO|nr:uncharacterized protein Z518_04652 [Rhinocladiella mackenziei CBS 650.93]KIX06676.1 hypothetical protein Z518_04652 [Rhinocladiella mackenziei CBS 650.93]
MPPFPGEETLATVYADLHTYFAAPSPRPFLHRFDKASYFYVYYNSTRHTSRIEVALHPGTPDQAAFNGFLDNVKIVHSHRFPTRLTLVVDGTSPPNASPSSARPGRDPDEWRLASADPRDTGTTKYRIHTIDFYFWVQDDSKLIVDILKKLLPQHQLDMDEIQEGPDHHDMVSPVVQNLENVAISDPAYQKDKSHGPAPAAQSAPTGLSPPPPPPPPPPTTTQTQTQATSPSPPSVTANVDGTSSGKTSTPATNYTPLAYNPAAPAAPEPIAHREDTPPPPDAADGTGLAAAAMHDNPYAHPAHQQSYGGAPGPQPSPYGHYGSPPPPSLGPQAAASSQPSFGPQAAVTGQPSFGPPATSPAPPQAQTSPPTSVSTNFAPPPSTAGADTGRHPSTAAQTYTTNAVQDPNAHILGQAAPVQTPATQFYSSINDQPHKPLQHVQPHYPDYLAAGHQAPAPPPPGGYSNYQYGQAQPQPAAAGSPYDVHHQVYRPTETEHHTHHHSKPSRTSSNPQNKPSQAERLEKGVGKLFKKIEKKIG